MKTILESTKDKVEAGKITIREAAIILHKVGFTNFVDVDQTKKLLNIIRQ